jgi:phospholipid/cholesterol/gamma-HCH transport system permease protein
MIAPADYSIEETPDGLALRFSGRLTLARIADLPERLNALRAESGPVRRMDLSAVERVDTVGAWVVQRIAREDGAEVIGATKEARLLLEAVADADQPVTIRPDRRSPIERMVEQLGAATIMAFRELGGILAFLGATIIALGKVLRHPRRLRWNAIITRFETVGVSALGIIGLMTFLIGIVMAQQGAVQLEQFGLEIFTINLVGRASVRELGLLMTAIMVAGRSGSAFAAQIGTMNLTEEVAAMRTIGVSPMEALVVPRVIAAVLMMPLLGFYASMCAIAGGGLFCWIGLDIPPLTFIQRLQEIIPMTDFWAMLIKAPVFGLIVAVVGCYEGMQVRGDAEQVGLRTTAAVVQGIFLVIVLDAFFAVFFSGIGWN